MRLCIVFSFYLFIYFFCVNYSYTISYPSNPREQNPSQNNITSKYYGFKCSNLLQIFVYGLCLVTSLWFMFLNLCNHVTYVRFDTDLTMVKRKGGNALLCHNLYLSLFLTGLLVSECPYDFSIQFILYGCPKFSLSTKGLNNCKFLARSFFHILCMIIFIEAISPVGFILCIFVLQVWYHVLTKRVPCWLPFMLIILANNIELNLGPP